ncbi:hypothetical protein AcV5_003302 [Taiwanofungus camphoratus]|nr:hypothetical protein AcV5_003302 [Antrodia cinnamomea]
MRALSIPYPSFTLAMSMIDLYSNRLPTYRSSHLLRYHPYPRVARRHDRDDPLMNTVDYRYQEELSCVLGVLRALDEQADPDGDVSTLHLDSPSPKPEQIGGGKVKKMLLASPLIIDIARRAKDICQAMKSWLPLPLRKKH